MAESEVFRIHEGRLRDEGPEAVVPLLTRAVETIEALYRVAQSDHRARRPASTISTRRPPGCSRPT